MKMVFDVAPKAVQSFRDAVTQGRDGKPRILRYQTAETRDFQRRIATGARLALGPEFRPWDGPIHTRTVFVFEVPKRLAERFALASAAGVPLYVTGRPDLSDNLHKGFLDALKGILYTDDARIVWSESRKVYGVPARIEFEAELIGEVAEQGELF